VPTPGVGSVPRMRSALVSPLSSATVPWLKIRAPPTRSQEKLTVWLGAKPLTSSVTTVPVTTAACVGASVTLGWRVRAMVKNTLAEVWSGPTARTSCGPNAAPLPVAGTVVSICA